MEDAFRDNFQGKYVRPPDADDLGHIVQQPGESARKLRTRFLVKKNQIVDCPDAEALAAFKHSIRDEWLARHLGQEKTKFMSALTALMTRFCVGEDSWLARRSNSASDTGTSEIRDGNDKPRRSKYNSRNDNERSRDKAVNAGFSNPKPGQRKKPFKANRDGPSNLDMIMDRPYQIHGHPDKPANHTNRNCWGFK